MTELRDIQPFKMQEDKEALLTSAGFMRFLDVFSRASDIAPPYWSKQRDAFLRDFWLQSDILSSIIYSLISKFTSMKVIVEPRDNSVLKHIQQAKQLQKKLATNSGLFGSFENELAKFILDVITTDNGGFLLILGEPLTDVSKPLEGETYALKHLDSLLCWRTKNDTYPVVYENPEDGKTYKIHKSRIIALTDMVYSGGDLNGVGYCGLSRAINTTKLLVGITNYQLETLGEKPARQILFGSGITTQQMIDSIVLSAQALHGNSESKGTFTKTIAIGVGDSNAKLERIQLANPFESFNTNDIVEMCFFIIGVAFGIDVKSEFNVSISNTGQNKADTLLSYLQSKTKTFGLITKRLEEELTRKFLPEETHYMYFDIIDDAGDRIASEISERRSVQRSRDIVSGVLDKRTARLQALKADEITYSEFTIMEMTEGRLPTGESILTLLFSDDPFFKEYFKFNGMNPIAFEKNDYEKMFELIDDNLAKTYEDYFKANAKGQEKLEQIQYTLTFLRKEYERVRADKHAGLVDAQERSYGNEEEIKPPVKIGRPATDAMKLNNEDKAMQEE